jgi:hypothetical protein
VDAGSDDEQADAAAAAAGDAATDAATDGGSPPQGAAIGVSFAVAVAVGWVNEEAAGDDATFGEVTLRAAYTRLARLEARLDLSLSTYGRTYLTRLPAAGAEGLTRVATDELRVRTSASVSWDVLPHHAFAADVAQLAPVALIEIDRFDNDVAPQTDFVLGLGARAFVRIADALRIEGEWTWAWHAYRGGDQADDLLVFGTVRGAMVYGLGAELLLPPRARLGVRWRGESLALERSNRHAHALVLLLGVDL